MEYVIPAVCILTIASMLTISTVQHLPVQEYGEPRTSLPLTGTPYARK